MTGRRGFTLIELMIVVAIIAVIASMAIPGLLSAQRASSERNASASLKTIGSAEADFRSNDKDGNLVNDFWTGDVTGLALIVTQPPGGGPPPMVSMNVCLKLIEIPMAAADGETGSGIRYANTMHVPYTTAHLIFVPKSGYLYKCMLNDNTGGIAQPFRVDTDGAGNPEWGACHNVDRFGFVTYPQSVNAGKLMYIINQEYTTYKMALRGDYTCTVTGLASVGPTTTTLANTGNAALNGADTQSYPDNPMSPAQGFSKLD